MPEFLAVQLCRVGVRVTFGEETRVTARFGLVRVQLLPRKEKKPPKERPKKEKKETKKPAKEPDLHKAVLGGLGT